MQPFWKGILFFSTSLNKLVKAEIQNIGLGWEERVLLLNCILVPRPSTVKRLYISFYGYTVGSGYEVNWTLMRFTNRWLRFTSENGAFWGLLKITRPRIPKKIKRVRQWIFPEIPNEKKPLKLCILTISWSSSILSGCHFPSPYWKKDLFVRVHHDMLSQFTLNYSRHIQILISEPVDCPRTTYSRSCLWSKCLDAIFSAHLCLGQVTCRCHDALIFCHSTLGARTLMLWTPIEK